VDLEAVATALAPRLIGYVLARTGCRGTAEDIAQDALSNVVGRRVVDRTGLSGNFDVDLTWTPDQMPPSFPRSDEPTTASSDGPSIFTAIREQLGLKLVAQKGLGDLLVIERAERPALTR
jgi:uncharacterized protein (TIGR03435 family)